jgi:hypothetical protein
VAPVDWAVGLCGVALIVSLWLPWYHVPASPATAHLPNGWTGYVPLGSSASFDAWQSMAVNDVILLIIGALAIAFVVATATQSSGAIPIASVVFVALGGILASVLTLVRLIWPPDIGPGPTDRAPGVWIAAAAAIGLAVTGWLSMRDERRSPSRVDVPVLPAPRGNSA